MNMHIKALSIAGAFAFGILLSLPMAAQGPTFIDPVSVVESDNVDSVMVAEWLVTNATDNPMTLYVERNVLQSVDPLNLPYETGAEGAYERFCWGGTCYPYGSASSVVGLALTLNPGDTTGLNAFGAEDWMISDYYPNGVAGATALEYCFKATEQGVPTVCHTVLFCAATEPGECVLSVDEPQGLQLGALAPNPVAGISALPYLAPQGGILRIVDLTGRTLKSVPLAPGSGSVWIDGDEFAPGTYLYALEANGRIGQARKFSVSR